LPRREQQIGRVRVDAANTGKRLIAGVLPRAVVVREYRQPIWCSGCSADLAEAAEEEARDPAAVDLELRVVEVRDPRRLRVKRTRGIRLYERR
jgi:hypothetical protein